MNITKYIPKSVARVAKGLMPSGDAGNLVTEEFWQSLGLTGRNYTNRRVDDVVMLETTSVYSAIRLISESIAALPLHLYERTDAGDRKATDHHLYDMLNKLPHRYTTRATFIEALVVSMCVWNQGYIRAPRAGSRVMSLQALPKPWVQPFFHKTTNELMYRVKEGSKTAVYEFGEIIPVKGFGHAADLEGISVPGLHRNAIGLAMAAEEYGSRFFANGARPGGLFTIDRILDKEQRERIRESIQERFGGSENAHKLMVLEAGMKYEAMQSNLNENQFVEVRKNQVHEVARIFRVPVHKLMEMSGAKYDNVEQENRAFLVDTLHSYLDRIELALDCFLLGNAERGRYFCKFNVEGRLRADLETRAKSYKDLILTGVMTPNEAREKENLKPDPGGDNLLFPLNMAPADLHAEVLQKHGSSPTPKDDKSDE